MNGAWGLEDKARNVVLAPHRTGPHQPLSQVAESRRLMIKENAR
jgi:hypothetical protein